MKPLLLFSFLSFSVITNAQNIRQGSYTIGADINFQTSGNKLISGGNNESTTNSSNLSISAGKAVKDNLLAGLNLLYNHSMSKTKDATNENVSTVNGYGGGAWVRRYFPVIKSFYFYTGGQLSVNTSNASTKSGGREVSTQHTVSLQAALLPGIAYQLSRSFFLEAGLSNLFNIQYSTGNTKYKNADGSIASEIKSHAFMAQTGIGNSNPLQLGMRWIIPH